MIIHGIVRIFDTTNQQQFLNIGKFWDEFSNIYGLENLRGIGYRWVDNKIYYMIGLKSNEVFDGCETIVLPNDNWFEYVGKTDELEKLYQQIYQDGKIDYEIEEFYQDGTCKIKIHRKIASGKLINPIPQADIEMMREDKYEKSKWD